jgi:hypothetical protein
LPSTAFHNYRDVSWEGSFSRMGEGSDEGDKTDGKAISTFRLLLQHRAARRLWPAASSNPPTLILSQPGASRERKKYVSGILKCSTKVLVS